MPRIMKATKKRPKTKARADGIPAAKGGVSSSNGGKVASSESGAVVRFEEDGMPQLVKNFYKFRLWVTTAAERSIDTILYTLMPALPENREPIGFQI